MTDDEWVALARVAVLRACIAGAAVLGLLAVVAYMRLVSSAWAWASGPDSMGAEWWFVFLLVAIPGCGLGIIVAEFSDD